jgi:hypothetical protein
MSATGQYQTMVGFNGSTSIVVYLSNDYGYTWTRQNPISVSNFDPRISITISGNGQYQFFSSVVNNLFISSNYGVTWTQQISTGITGTWFGIAMSANYKYLTGVTLDGIFTSVTPEPYLSISNGSVFGGDVSMNSRLFVNGNIYTGGSVIANGVTLTSDYRIKENIITLNNNHIVDNLRPVEYYNKQINKKDIGLIAHELQEQYPSLVDGIKDGDDLQTVNYIGLIPIIINEIKNLKKNNLTHVIINENPDEIIFDCSKRTTFYLNSSIPTNFTSKFINIPKIYNQTYSVSIIINTSVNKIYSDKVLLDDDICNVYFENNFNTSDIENSSRIIQKFIFINIGSENTTVLSKVTTYK